MGKKCYILELQLQPGCTPCISKQALQTCSSPASEACSTMCLICKNPRRNEAAQAVTSGPAVGFCCLVQTKGLIDRSPTHRGLTTNIKSHSKCYAVIYSLGARKTCVASLVPATSRGVWHVEAQRPHSRTVLHARAWCHRPQVHPSTRYVP